MKKTFKSIFTAILSLGFTFGCISCNPESGSAPDDSTQENVETGSIWTTEVDETKPFFTVIEGGTPLWDEDVTYENEPTLKITISDTWSFKFTLNNKTNKKNGYIVFWICSDYNLEHESSHAVKVADGSRVWLTNYFTTEWTKVRVRAAMWNSYVENKAEIRINDDHNVTGVTYWMTLPTWQEALV